MKAKDLKRGQVYMYTSSAEKVEVMYLGTRFCPGKGWGYGFEGRNEETGEFEGGYFNILSDKAVENQISEK